MEFLDDVVDVAGSVRHRAYLAAAYLLTGPPKLLWRLGKKAKEGIVHASNSERYEIAKKTV